MDLSKLDVTKPADKGAVMQVLDPWTNKPIEGMTVTLLGNDSTLRLKRLADINSECVGEDGNVNIDAIRDKVKDIRVASTIAWTGFCLNGKELECTPENVRMIYDKTGFHWLVGQVDKFMGKRANFLSNADGK